MWGFCFLLVLFLIIILLVLVSGLAFHDKLNQFCFQSGERSVLPIKTSLFFPVVRAD